MAVQAAVYRDNLTGKKRTLIGSKIYAHIGNIRRTAIPVHHNIIQENILQNLRYLPLIIRCNNQTGRTQLQRILLLPYCRAVDFVSISTPAFAQA